MADKRIDELTALASVETTDLIPVWDSSVGQTKNIPVGDVSHTKLDDIGTNAHSVIDTFIASKAQASGLASLDGSSLVVQNPANATSTPTASKIPIADISGKLDSWVTAELTANQLAALAGTSGTPSGTNKFVTNDDTATAATADKVARRLAGGNITVVTEAANNNSTNAASTAYVDTADALITASADTTRLLGAGNAIVKGYVNSQMLFYWSGADAMKNFARTTLIQSVDTGFYYCEIGGSSDNAHALISSAGIGLFPNSSNKIRWSSSKIIIVEFNLGMGETSGSEQAGWGLASGANIATAVQDFDYAGSACALFTYATDAKLYAKTSTGGGTTNHTETEITGVTLNAWNLYRIEYTPATNVKFYVNGVLKATITTTLPAAAEDIQFAVGATGTTNEPRVITAPAFSIQR